MQTFLYNLNTQQREGEIREGRYLVDGQPGALPDFLVELEIENRPDPVYNTATQTLEGRSFADLANFKWVNETYVRNLTQQEIDQRLPQPPDACTPRQLRIALIQTGISPSVIDAQIEAIPDPVQKEIASAEWEYALEIKKEHPLVAMMAVNLNLSEQQVNDIFSVAVTL
jgi:hypothetical protein